MILLGEYEMRLESEEYRREHDRIAASVSANMRRLSRQLAPMRAKLRRRGLGLSREETRVALSLFLLETVMYGINTVLDLAENEDPELVSWREDERVAAWSKLSSLNLLGDLNSLDREMQMSRRDRRLAERFWRRFGKKLRRKIAIADRDDLETISKWQMPGSHPPTLRGFCYWGAHPLPTHRDQIPTCRDSGLPQKDFEIVS